MAVTLGDEIRRRPELGYRLAGYVGELFSEQDAARTGRLGSVSELDHLPQLLVARQVEDVLVALPLPSQHEVLMRVVSTCRDMGITVHVAADDTPLRLEGARPGRLGATPVVTLHAPRPTGAALAVKRGIDVAAAAAGLLLTAPLFPLVGLAIKLDSPGPVFFRQSRVGLHRRRFGMLKFRTMAVGAEAAQAALESRNVVRGAAFKLVDDPRVTRVGRWLRRTSVDELPQLWNVVRGEMSLVGPRPPLPSEVALYHLHHYARFDVKPGITGPWQVNGRNQITDFEEVVRIETSYIREWSLWKDIQILARTAPVVLRMDGAH